MALLDVHDAWAWVAVVANGAAGAWALAAHGLATLRHRALWWFVGGAQLTMFAQVVLGVLLVTVEDVPAPEFHMFYGFLTILAVGLVHSYRSQVAEWRYLLYGLGSLFIMGLGIRAMFLG